MNGNLVLVIAVALTTTSLVVCIALAVCGVQSEFSSSLFETCSTTWKMGFGAVIGVLSGRQLSKREGAHG